MAGRALVTGATGFIGGRLVSALFDVQPIGFDEALRRAIADDPEMRGGR